MLKLPEILRGQSFINEALLYALNRNPDLKEVSGEKVSRLAKDFALEMAEFEEMALTRRLYIPETAEGAKRMIAIWDLSGVGTYLKEFQDDRWKGTSWAGWTDRKRLEYSTGLMRRFTEKVTGNRLKTSLGEKLIPEQIQQLRSNIGEYGPYLIYGSTQEQNDDVREALLRPGVIIPRDKVHIIDFPGKPVGVNTIDQMKTFSFPPNLEINEGDVLALVAHAPHLVRALHMMNRFRPLPVGVILQLYPLSSPCSANTDWAKQEISGLLYYTLITGDSAEEAYPYHR